VLVGLVALHLWALHVPGNNNPVGVEVKAGQDTIPFHPYYTIKDGFAAMVFLMLFAAFVFYAPTYMGHAINFEPANPLVTPAHIVPEWYFLPYYAILRAVPDKLLGVVLMFGSILILLALPWLDTSKVKSATFRPIYRQFFWVFVVTTIVLGVVGANPPEGGWLILGRIATAYYFLHFLVILPLIGVLETPRPLPASISDAVLAGKKVDSQVRAAQ
jgi:ubiquinol-cytochrome c reductase cytochrome b subunit